MQYTLFKKPLHNLLVLVSFILCLGAGSCSQCKKMPEQEFSMREVVVEIVPLKSLSLTGEDKTIHFKLQQVANSAAVDLAKLRLKITTVSTPASEVKQVQYKNAPLSEIAGNQVRLDQEIKLTLVTTNATEQVNITLELIYEDKPMKGVNNSQTFTWEKINDVTQKLFEAIRAQDKIKALDLLKQGNIEENDKFFFGQTLLRHAINYNSDIEVVKKIIELPDTDVNADNPTYEIGLPLDLAIQQNRLDIIQALLPRGAKVLPKHINLLHAAIKENKANIIIYALEKFNELKDTQDEEGNTPLHKAVQQQYPRLINLLLSKGASRSIKNKANLTPMELAAKKQFQTEQLRNEVMGTFDGTYQEILTASKT